MSPTLDYQWIRQTKTSLPNNVTTEYSYNANSWLAAIQTKQNANPLSTSNYTFDKTGNITQKTGDTNISYGYDKTYQLITAGTETFSYDKTGNRADATVNTNNELTQSPEAAYTHDANGNTVTKTVNGQTTSFSYDARDRLTGILLPDGKVITYTYDPFGRRVSKNVNGTITHYIYSDEGLIGEYAQDGTVQKTYTWQPDSTWGTNPVTQTIGNNTYYYHNDHLGTTQKLTDESGSVVWSATYSAFGKATVTTATITNNLRYPGQYYDEETGLHYNWQRYYDPAEGRYVSVDPIGFEAGDENLYRYVFNGPVNEVDPEGLRPLRTPYIRPRSNPFIDFEVRMLLRAIRKIEPNYREPASIRAPDSPRYNRDDIRYYRNYLQNIKPSNTGPCSRNGHHSDPKFMGGNPNQRLSDIPTSQHKELHRDLNNFLRNRTDKFGNHMRPQRGNSGENIRDNFTREERLKALAEFYRINADKYPSASRDFFIQHPGLE